MENENLSNMSNINQESLEQPQVQAAIPAQQPQVQAAIPAQQPQVQAAIPAQQPPQAPSAFDAQSSIIEQQNAQIQALMNHNAALNQQVISLVQGGAQFNSQQSAQVVPSPTNATDLNRPTQIQQMAALGVQPDPLGSFNPPALTDNVDMSLEALASEIGNDRS